MRKPLRITLPTTVKEVGIQAREIAAINNDCRGVITLPNGDTIKGRRKRFFGIPTYFNQDGEEVRAVLGFLPTEWAYNPSDPENQEEESNAKEE